MATILASVLLIASLLFPVQPAPALDVRSQAGTTPPGTISAAAAGRYVTAPSDFPSVTVTVPANGTADGFVFANSFPWLLPTQNAYLLILDNNGEPVFYQRLHPGHGIDFKRLPDGTLSYWEGNRSGFVILDNSYREVNFVAPGNGYTIMDVHELQLLPNGNYLFLAGDTQTVDMSKLVPGGNPQAAVLQQIIQEVDRNKNVVFQWRSLDHIPVTDSDQPLTDANIDYIHANALELDSDGNILLSSRHLDEITKINRQTGEIIWRLGGKANQFTFATAPGISGPAEFYHQHDIRRLPNGHITLFDNHNEHDAQASRGLEYILDENAKTATLVAEYRNAPDVFSLAMGNAQRLPNGNTLVDWGSNFAPNLTEFKPDGSKAFEMDFAGPLVTYRAFRFPWQGRPTWPATAVVQAATGGIKLTFSWNGATDIASYRIYGGTSSSADTLIKEVPRSGFETSADLLGADGSNCFYRVMPIDTQGQTTQFSSLALNTIAGDPSCFKRTYLPTIGSAGAP